MKIIVYKTFEVPEELWGPIADGFNESFDANATADSMKNAFCIQNVLGYGYHAVALSDEGEVMGYNVFSPTFYEGGIKAVVSGSTYVRPKFRSNEMLFWDLVMALRSACKKDGYEVELGVPNNNSRNFALKVLKFKHVAYLKYYLLPIKISKVLDNNKLSMFDCLFKSTSYVLLFLSRLISSIINTRESKAKYELCLSDEYYKVRFPSSMYKQYKEDLYIGYYRIYTEGSAKVAYLMDYRENGKRSFKALTKTVCHIIRNEDVDAVMYVGNIRHFQTALIRVPFRVEPKHLPFTCYCMSKPFFKEHGDIQDFKNWDFSLMNFDVR